MGKSQKATCESKALEGLFPSLWVHKLDTAISMPLAGTSSSWVAPTREFLKLEERGGGRQANPIGSDTTHSNSHRRSAMEYCTFPATIHADGPRELAASAFHSSRAGETGQACRQRALAVAFEAGAFLGCPQREYSRVKKGKCYTARGHSRVLK